jgi:hypothetical protein
MANPIVVRLFSDYADSVIWAPYAVDYTAWVWSGS